MVVNLIRKMIGTRCRIACLCGVIVLMCSGAILSAFPTKGLSGNDDAGSSYPQEFLQELILDAVHRVETPDTPIPFLVYIKDGENGMKVNWFAVYDVSDGSNPPSWDSPESDNAVVMMPMNGRAVDRRDWYVILDTFINDGPARGQNTNWTPLTPRNLGYGAGQTITFTARISVDNGVWGVMTRERDLKVRVGDAPLPKFENWYYGDSHYHSWKTFNLYELGGPTEMVAYAAQAMGLDWITITDHSCDFILAGHEADWGDLGVEVKDLSNEHFTMIRGEELSIKGYYGPFGLRHMLLYGIENMVEGDQLGGPWYFDQILGQSDYPNNLAAQGGFAYSAHPGSGDDSFFKAEGVWPDSDNDRAVQFDTFRGLEFLNGPASRSAEDAFHPWGARPHTGDWATYNPTWREATLDGMADWDRLNSNGLAAGRKLFCLGGSDAHGDFNYFIHIDVAAFLDLVYDEDAESYAIGKGRTLAYLPDGNNETAVLDALYHGRTVITDGPVMIFGIDGNGDGSFYGSQDLRIADGPTIVSSSSSILGFFKSTPEYGRIKAIYFYLGTSSTGREPILCSSVIMNPHLFEGSFAFPISSCPELMNNRYTNVYLRAECYTFDPAQGVPMGGDALNASHNTEANSYDYRCWTNPIWIRIDG